MGFTKALFYPTIDIRNEDLLKNAVLFWDEINTIVPSSITNNVMYSEFSQNGIAYRLDDIKPYIV
jgi:hypothetical protein